MEAKAKVALAQGWSSLPADLVNRVADCLLATNDLDYYVDLRAVCQHWRSSTADPRSNPHDPRFRPTQWVMLDEVKHKDYRDDDRLFVNAATGRFLRRSLPVLRDYVLVTSTTGGLLVLATTARDSAAPTRASLRVLNPFTGCSIDFAAPMPRAPWRFTAEVVGSSPTLVLFSILQWNSGNTVYWAEPQSASFSVARHTKCAASILPLIAAAKCDAVKRCSGSKGSNIFNRLAADVCCAVRVHGAHMLAVHKRGRGVDVFKVDADGNMMRRVRSIGNVALFLGIRCVAVDVDMFKGIQANCAYFTKSNPCSHELEIYKVDIEAGAEEQEPEFVETAVWSFHLTPFTLTQVLCNYTMDIARHPPTWYNHIKSFFEMTKNNCQI